MVRAFAHGAMGRRIDPSWGGNVLFNDALNTFSLQLYGVGYMIKDHSDSERGNTLPPHGLLFPINSKGSFIRTIPHTSSGALAGMRNRSMGPPHEVYVWVQSCLT